MKRRRNKKSQQEAPYQQGGFFTTKSTYEFARLTQGRDVTDIEWCPSHKEWVLASYNSVSVGLGGGGGGGGSGIISIYNLLMPERPEHIFCSGCPILHSQFHPTEHPKLVLGGASSGQILVWDARVGRYPVQRSSVTSGGHDCELVGMKVLSDGGAAGGGAGGSMSTSKLVTASSDGKINYWSVSNLREPVEYVTVNANLSFVRTLYSGGGGGLATTASPLDDELDNLEEEKVDMGHYGMVTSVSTRPYMTPSNTPRSSKESTDASSGGMSKGFLRGAGGLVVTTGVDWSTKLWAPAYSDLPLMSFLSSSYDYMCDVQWSPVHPSVFATASSNGTLSLWNLATSLDQPVTGGDSSRRGLNRLKWSADGRRMAVASGDKLHVLGVGEDIWKSKGDEESRVMNNLVSRGFIQEV
ncbi:cytoplasmic dynein intermediate chain-like protein [Thalassiosira pseudonana CCMP1335]|uniref:Cytoplasmic dynein intermediate chain-like protein n=1 Tax=Thalassiosira pseudonana TaxID=35128 RepID=B8C4R0_THAPS|nr:cytoplasmic dynein intermediate chain-like protein [Thalassiosira pseudonana CCMP1335]EED91367.1 cytoplasmic dynein intermediate chain-like protein [Thalassiosira pseudonana CCMP1335]